MSNGSVMKRAVLAVAVFAVVGGAFAKNNTAEPTHYLFMPTARINQPGELVLGLHEISYALPGNLQLQCSLLDNVGRLALAAKYGFHRDLAGGLGLAHSLIGYGEHAIYRSKDKARFGAFLAYEFNSRYYDMVLTGHTQIAKHFSIGADLGGKITPTNIWSFLWEVGISVDTYSKDDNGDDQNDGGLYLYGIGGIRFNLPNVPGLFFDIGVQAKESNITGTGDDDGLFGKGVGIFFDVMYCWKP